MIETTKFGALVSGEQPVLVDFFCDLVRTLQSIGPHLGGRGKTTLWRRSRGQN